MVGVRAILTLTGVVLLAGCGEPPAAPVRAEDFDAFFLWAGVRAPPALDRARTIYLLAGEVRADSNARMIRLRAATPRVSHADVWLTVRVERIDWEPGVYDQVLGELARWRAAGARVVGLQIDFDARTHGLGAYARFLADLRRRMPADMRLSVTGLMDWSANGDPRALAGLAGVVDEVVIQTYQGRRTIPGYGRWLDTWLDRSPRFGMPYRVALVEHGEWRAPPGLARDPHFRGYVVFLLGD